MSTRRFNVINSVCGALHCDYKQLTPPQKAFVDASAEVLSRKALSQSGAQRRNTNDIVSAFLRKWPQPGVDAYPCSNGNHAAEQLSTRAVNSGGGHAGYGLSETRASKAGEDSLDNARAIFGSANASRQISEARGSHGFESQPLNRSSVGRVAYSTSRVMTTTAAPTYDLPPLMRTTQANCRCRMEKERRERERREYQEDLIRQQAAFKADEARRKAEELAKKEAQREALKFQINERARCKQIADENAKNEAQWLFENAQREKEAEKLAAEEARRQRMAENAVVYEDHTVRKRHEAAARDAAERAELEQIAREAAEQKERERAEHLAKQDAQREALKFQINERARCKQIADENAKNEAKWLYDTAQREKEAERLAAEEMKRMTRLANTASYEQTCLQGQQAKKLAAQDEALENERLFREWKAEQEREKLTEQAKKEAQREALKFQINERARCKQIADENAKNEAQWLFENAQREKEAEKLAAEEARRQRMAENAVVYEDHTVRKRHEAAARDAAERAELEQIAREAAEQKERERAEHLAKQDAQREALKFQINERARCKQIADENAKNEAKWLYDTAQREKEAERLAQEEAKQAARAQLRLLQEELLC